MSQLFASYIINTIPPGSPNHERDGGTIFLYGSASNEIEAVVYKIGYSEILRTRASNKGVFLEISARTEIRQVVFTTTSHLESEPKIEIIFEKTPDGWGMLQRIQGKQRGEAFGRIINPRFVIFLEGFLKQKVRRGKEVTLP